MILLPTILYTIVAITGLMGCLMSLVLYFLKKTYPKPINGLGDWALFPLLAFFASFLYGMQGKWHHLISMALPNLLLVLTAVTQLRGTYRHFEKPVNTKLIAVIVFIALLLILWSSGKSEYYLHRLLSMTGFLAIMFAAQLKALWARRRESFATKLMVITLAFLCITMAIRFISALIEPPPVGVFVFSPLQAFYLSGNSVGILLLSICAILLSSEQLRNEMEKLLRHDALTGALTRRTVFEYAENELARSSRRDTPFSMLLMDLDRFKEINDKHGHQVGDTVLTNFVQCVEQVLRRPSVIGRYGGEEFIVILPETTKEQAVQVAERIQSHLRTQPVPLKVTASIGVACSGQAKHDTLDAMIGRADAALYAAKRKGRDRIEVEDMQRDAQLQEAR
jgi:diguanylate cyclase (GGDEF)-like protein